MKKLVVVVLAVIMLITLGSGIALAEEYKIDPYDEDIPQISYVVSGNEAIFTIYDEDKIERIFINGEEMKINEPKATVTYTYKLINGENTVKVAGVDRNQRMDICTFNIQLGQSGQIDNENPSIEMKFINSEEPTVIVSDDVEVSKLLINNKEINIIKGTRVTHTINNLKQGINDIKIVAIDSSNKSTTETYSINYNNGVTKDTEKPQINYLISGQNLVVTVTDNIGVAAICINSESISNLSGKTYIHTVKIKSDTTEIRIEALDSSSNSSKKIIKIENSKQEDDTKDSNKEIDIFDLDKPEISYVVKGDKAIFTIYDEDKIELIEVNDKKIIYDNPKQTVTYEFNLINGTNIIKIIGVDLNQRCTIEDFCISIDDNGLIDKSDPKIDLNYYNNEATIIATDDVEIVAIRINGKEQNITKGNRVKYILKEFTQGINEVQVIAIDSSGKRTEETYSFEYKNGAIMDTEEPQLSYKVSGSDVTITITDNFALHSVIIDNKLVTLNNKKTYIHTIKNLEAGLNTIKIQAADTGYNTLLRDLTIQIDSTEKNVTSYDKDKSIIPLISFALNEKTDYGVIESKNSITMVPVRFAELLGATISWDSTTNTVRYTFNGKIIEMTIGSNKALINGKTEYLKESAYLNSKNRAMVPIRMIAEQLGFNVKWVANDKQIVIE